MVLISLGIILEPQLEEGIEMELDCKFKFSWISKRLEQFLFLSKIELKVNESRYVPLFVISG